MPNRPGLRFGIKTVPMAAATYRGILRVWAEADEISEIEDAWLWDHLLPLRRPATEPALDGWTLLPALAARTARLRMGVMVTSNALRPPAMLAKIAATADVVADGRLIVGLGVGGTRLPEGIENPAVPEYAAYGIPLWPAADGVGRLAETCMLLRRLWTETEPFDVDGRHIHVRGAICEPKPVQRPGPPILIGGWGNRVLGIVAQHADMWNIPGPPHNPVAQLAERSRALDQRCAAIGRDPGDIIRSTQITASYTDPGTTRSIIGEVVAAGFSHIVINLAPPFRDRAASWAAAEIIRPMLTGSSVPAGHARP